MNSEKSPETLLKDVEAKEISAISPLDSNLHNHSLQVSLTSRKITRFFFSIILILLIASLTGLFLKYYWNMNSAMFAIIYRFFDFNKEANIPTFFSSILLLFASLTLLFVYKTVITKKKYWLFLSGLFLFLCIDEAIQIHENFDKLKSRVEVLSESPLWHVWVLPYLLLIVFLGIFLKGFIISLPSKTRNLMILSGIVFVGAAGGLEIIEGQLAVLSGGVGNISLDLLYGLEEICEMTGVTVFIYALLDYIAPKNSSISIRAGN